MVAPANNSPHWTLDTLFIHLTSRIDAVKENVTTAMTAADRAVSKAETATEKRFDSVNEFRAVLSDQSKTLLPRTEYASQHQNIVEKFDLLSERVGRIEAAGVGKREGMSSIGAIVIGILAGMGALAAIGAFILSLARHAP